MEVEELKAQKRSSTPPKVLEECKKITSKAVGRIEEGEKLCTEAIVAVSVT